MNDREAYIALNMMEGMGPVRSKKLQDALGAPGEIFKADAALLCRVSGIGPKLAASFAAQSATLDPTGEEKRARAIGARIVTPLDDEYPDALRTIYDPPLALYVRGTLKAEDERSLAMVGSRRCSHYGKATADRLAFQLAKVGYTVVSGLARGIDTYSHEGALKGGGRTIAFLGGALDCLYPPENADLAERIVKQGAIISEFPLGREPDKTTFPYRNRLVSGFSQGVIVVESPTKSGSLITADAAMEQGRSVFAVPGRIDTPYAQGCHRLIKNGAKLVEGVDDILEEFDMLMSKQEKDDIRQETKRPDVPLNAEEELIVRALAKGDLDVDRLARKSGVAIGKLSGLLFALEMKRVVRMLPGRRVELAVSREDFK